MTIVGYTLVFWGIVFAVVAAGVLIACVKTGAAPTNLGWLLLFALLLAGSGAWALAS